MEGEREGGERVEGVYQALHCDAEFLGTAKEVQMVQLVVVWGMGAWVEWQGGG